MLTKSQLSNLRRATKKQREDINVAQFKFSELLWKTVFEKSGGLQEGKGKSTSGPPWLHWGYESWEAYVQTELELHPRTAWTYVRVWQQFGIDLKGKWRRSDLRPFSKMVVIEPVVNATNVASWLKRAKDLSVPELREAVKARTQKKRPSMLKHVGATVTPNQLGMVLYSFDLAKSAGGFHARGDALHAITKFFVQHFNPQKHVL